MYVVSIDDTVYPSRYISKTFDGDVTGEFLKQIIKIRDELDAIPDKDMIFTEQNKLDYESTNICWICHGKTHNKVTIKKIKKKDGTETEKEHRDNL